MDQDNLIELHDIYETDVNTHRLFYETIQKLKQEMRNDPFYHTGIGLDLSKMTDDERENMFNFHFIAEWLDADNRDFELFKLYMKLRHQYFAKQRYTSFPVYNEFKHELRNLITKYAIDRASKYYCTNLDYYDKFYRTYEDYQPLSLQDIAGNVIRSRVQLQDQSQLPISQQMMRNLSIHNKYLK
jgi:hypothetical protein